MTTPASNPVTSCGHEHEDGAYVLGALSPEERVAFERHLPGCDSCARSVRELAGLPGLLARVPIEIVDPEQLPTPVPDTLLPALVRRVRRSQRRRTWLTGGLVAAAAVVALGAVGAATIGGDDTPPIDTATAVHMTVVGNGPVDGWLSMTKVGWGTRLDLECSYSEANPYHDGAVPTYTMVVTTTDGDSEQVASWKGLPGKTLHLTAATAADKDDIADVEIRTGAGATVLELHE